MFGFLKSIVGGASKVFAVSKTIVLTALPILKAMRPAIEEVDEAFTYIEGKVVEGGIVADDFLDGNIDLIRKLDTALSEGSAYMAQGAAVTAKLIEYSQVATPDTITEEEALDLINELAMFRNIGASFKDSADAAILAAEGLQE